jgi:hypothetical protein
MSPMLTPHRSSRVLLVANGRSDGAEVGQVPVRRFRLARVRVSAPAGTTPSRVTRAKTS